MYKQYRKMMAIIILVLATCIMTACGGSDIDWNQEVGKRLDQYTADFDISEPVVDEKTDRLIYTITTNDENAITFHVICRYERQTSPLGGRRLFKQKTVTDTFYQAIQNMVSKRLGTVDITDMTADETIQYMEQAFDEVHALCSQYGVMEEGRPSPQVHFYLTNGQRTYDFTASEKDADRFPQILLEKLGKR